MLEGLRLNTDLSQEEDIGLDGDYIIDSDTVLGGEQGSGYLGLGDKEEMESILREAICNGVMFNLR